MTKLRPTAGDRIIRDPVTRERMPAEGWDLPDPLPTYWIRRINQGDVELVPTRTAPKRNKKAPNNG